MREVRNLPRAFERFEKMMGVLQFAVFEDSDGSVEQRLSAVPAALGNSYSFDIEALRAIEGKRLNRQDFLGDCCRDGQLIHPGHVETMDGLKFDHPRIVELEGKEIRGASGTIPEMGEPGNFAYAFLCTPYSLRGSPVRIQNAFDWILDFILPARFEAEITCWNHDDLTKVSSYFEMGAEWWGMFLFSIHVPALRRLTIVAGSATD